MITGPIGRPETSALNHLTPRSDPLDERIQQKIKIPQKTFALLC